MVAAPPTLYPLRMQRKLVHRLWGGHRLVEWLNLPEPYPEHLGESWEVFDTNLVRNGNLAGWTLAEVAARYQEQLVGSRACVRYGEGFPLLVKFIDANERLSIQVHPDDSYAHTYEKLTGFHGKSEAWYVLDASSSADIVYGLNEPISRETFERMVREGTIEQILQHVPVSVGDVIFVPAGTLHAINAGLLLFEVQEKSDLTYRVYDYGRIDSTTGQPRTLHLDKALAVANLAPPSSARSEPLPLEPENTRMLLVASPHFALERMRLTRERRMQTSPESLEIVTVIGGEGNIVWPEGSLTLAHGESAVIPAHLGCWKLSPRSSELHILRVYIPDLERDVIAPLKALGFADSRIIRILREV